MTSSARTGTEDISFPPLEGAERVVGTMALSLAMLMNVIDMTIANVSIPAISGDLGVSPAQGTWIVTSYGVANALSVILTGWLARRLGHVRLIVGAILMFAASSLVCAMAPTLAILVFFRLIQGMTAGPIVVLTQPLLLQSYPPEKISIALSTYLMTTMIGPIFGPVIGGVLTDGFSWHWIFYINIPVGVVAASLVWKIYRHRETPGRKVPLDLVGLALLVACVGSMQLMVEKGRELDWFSSDFIVALGLVSLVCGVYFGAWNTGARHPIVDFSFFRQRNFVIGAIVMSVGFGVFMGSGVIMSIWLQQNMGYTATWAGLTMIPGSIVALVLTPVTGRAMERIDLRWVALISVLALMGAFLFRTRLASDIDLYTVVLFQLAQGVGMAMFFVPMLTMALQGIPPDKMAGGAGLLAFIRYVGGSSGTSLIVTLWERRTDHHIARLYEQFNVFSPTLQDWSARVDGRFDYAAMVRIAQLKAQIEATTLGADDTFLFCAVVFGGMAAMIAASRAHRKSGARVQPVIE